MDKYRKIVKEKDQTAKPENEIRLTSQGSVSAYVSRAAHLYGEGGETKIVITAIGNALSKAVTLAEVVKRRFKGLHQNTKIGNQEMVDEYEPLEEGLDKVTDTRQIPFIEITLSKEALDTTALGYQPPIPEDQVKEMTEEDIENEKSKRGRGGGRGKGRGKGKGKEDGKGKGKGKDKGKGKGKEVKGKAKGKGKEEAKGKGKGKGKEEAKGKGKGKGKDEPKGKGKGKGKAEEKGKGKGKGKGEEKGKGKDKGKGKGKDSGKGKGKSQGWEDQWERPSKGKGKGKSKSYSSWDDDWYPSNSYSKGSKGSKGKSSSKGWSSW